jgi:LysR substrate binding domain-containing protein
MPSLSGSFQVLRDDEKTDTGVDSPRRHLANFSFQFVQNGSYLIPVQQGLIITGNSAWNYIVGPGRVWQERGDHGYTRTSFPFALVERSQNCVHNGEMTFLFKNGNSFHVSQVRYQITQETCEYFKFNMWGEKGNLAAVQMLIDHRANINQSFGVNQTAIGEAIQKGYADVANYLASHGATMGPGAVFFAAMSGSPDLVSLALESKPDQAMLNQALAEAAGNGHIDESTRQRILKLLLSHGADTDAPQNGLPTGIMPRAFTAATAAYLLDHGANSRAKLTGYELATGFCANGGVGTNDPLPLDRMLVARGMDFHDPGSGHSNPLTYAVSANRIDLIDFLLQLRICAPVTFARLHLVPRLATFLDAHPKLRMEIILDDRVIDLLEENIDVALRLGELKDSALTASKLAESDRIIVASSTYLAQRGVPYTPADLLAHDGIVYAPGTGGDEWRFRQGTSETSIRIQSRLVITAAEGIRAAVIAGLGLTAASRWMFAPELASGLVRQVLSDWMLPPVPVWYVYPAGRLASAKAREFVKWFQRVLA